MTLGRGGSCRRDHHARHLLSVLGVGKAGAVHPSLALLRPHRPARRRPPAVWTGRLEVEQLRRSIAMLARVPATPSAGRTRCGSSPSWGDVQSRLDDLKRRLRELAEEAQPAGAATPTPSNRGGRYLRLR